MTDRPAAAPEGIASGKPSPIQQTFWRAAEQAAKAGELIKALVLFEAGRVA